MTRDDPNRDREQSGEPPAETELSRGDRMKGGGLLSDEPIFNAILWVMVLSVVAGVAMALVGDLVLANDAVRNTGTGIGVVSGAIYFAFRWLGKREAARRDRDR